MALSHKAKKRVALVVLVLWLPAYVVGVVSLMNWLFPDPLNRPAVWMELGIYVGSGILWAWPFKGVFKGVGQADPNAPEE